MTESVGALGALAAVLLAGIVVVVMMRRRRARAAARLRDDADFDLRFPDTPADHPPRGTVTGRRIARP